MGDVLIPEPLLRSILDRLDTLEKTRPEATANEQISPNYLTVKPDGTTGAAFSGIVSASELNLNAGPGGSPIKWLRQSDGAVLASIASDASGNLTFSGGTFTGGLRIPEQTVDGGYNASNALGFPSAEASPPNAIPAYINAWTNAQTHNMQHTIQTDPNLTTSPIAQISLKARDTAQSLSGSSLVYVTARDTVNGTAITRTILSSDGHSSFLQPTRAGSYQFNWGLGYFIGAGGSPQAGITQAHSMGITPDAAWFAPVGWGPGTIVNLAVPDATNLNMQAWVSGAIFGNGSPFYYYWLAVGTP